ncbi:MAG: hypothetical protein FWE80_00275 [Oscillospiraceae bacterium]|nr:hypothetical protein [Oscillospiraceae bacterium]
MDMTVQSKSTGTIRVKQGKNSRPLYPHQREAIGELNRMNQRLLKHFGYKRRSPVLVQQITAAMTALSLTPYLKGYKPCDVAAIDIDDMVERVKTTIRGWWLFIG